MQQFTDKTGRQWTLRITIRAAKSVRSQIPGIDLTQLDEAAPGLPPLGVRLTLEPILACDVIFALCREQADREQISDADFGELMEGPVLGPAMQALHQELLDFFRALGRGDVVELLQRQTTVLDAAVENSRRELAKLLAKLQEQHEPPASPPTTGS